MHNLSDLQEELGQAPGSLPDSVASTDSQESPQTGQISGSRQGQWAVLSIGWPGWHFGFGFGRRLGAPFRVFWLWTWG